jgi:hypothetical protein
MRRADPVADADESGKALRWLMGCRSETTGAREKGF